MSMLLKFQIVHVCAPHHRAANERFSTLKRTKTDDTQPKLNVVCFVVQSCLADADFVIPSNYCLIVTRERVVLFSYIAFCLHLEGQAFIIKQKDLHAKA